MLCVYTIVETGSYGWASAHTAGFGALSALLMGAFVVRQVTTRNPLLALHILRSRNVGGANLIQALMVAGMLGFFFLCTLYLRQVLGYRPLEIGLGFLPVAVAIGALSLGFSARLSTRFGARAILVPGLASIATALALLTRAPVHSAYTTQLLPAMVLLGVGAGLSFPPLMTLGMSGVAPSDRGIASGLVNTTAQVGGALGLAVLATVSESRTNALLSQGHGTASALTGGFHLVFAIGAGLMAAAILLALTVLQSLDAEASSNQGRPPPAATR